MGEFGKVQVGFWNHPKIKPLGDSVKLLAIYLLSSKHKNSLGCYYLPYGYCISDLGWSERKTKDTFSILYREGFCKHCQATDYVFIPDFLEWNRVQNQKHAKAVERMFYDVPKHFSYFNELINSLKSFGRYFSNGFDTVLKEYRYTETETETETETCTSGAHEPEPVEPVEKFPHPKKLEKQGGKYVYPEAYRRVVELHPDGGSFKEGYDRWWVVVQSTMNGAGPEAAAEKLLIAFKAYLADCKKNDRLKQDIATFFGTKKATWQQWVDKPLLPEPEEEKNPYEEFG